MIKNKIFITLFFLGTFVYLPAQNLEEILQQIQQNNKELQVLQKEKEASNMGIKARNNISPLSVQYSPFYATGVKGLASSELIVSQDFDFPSLYAARYKSGLLQQQVLDLQYLIARRDILFKAKFFCLDLIRLNKEKALLAERCKNADELLLLFEKRFKEGDATILEMNKVKMDRMNVQTEVLQNESLRKTIEQSLLILNGNQPVSFQSIEYPIMKLDDFNKVYNDYLNSALTLKTAQTSVRASFQDVQVNKQNWLPKLQVGYRRNMDFGEVSNGFLVGASIPLFSNRNLLKMAKARYVGAQLQLDNTQLQVETQVRMLFNQKQQLQKTIEIYDVNLLQNTLGLLRKAVEQGRLSIIEYYIEADDIYKNMQAYLEIENHYQKVLAEIYKNEL